MMTMVIIIVLVVTGVVAVAVAVRALLEVYIRRETTARLRELFGPEYKSVLARYGERRKVDEGLAARGKRLRILVVEDHADTLKVLGRLLNHFGYDITLADGAQRALQIIDSKEFDIVLSDIGLPDGSGYEVITQAKQKQRVKGIALTGFCKDEDIMRSREAGFDFHLAKPVDFHELRSILAQVA